MNSFFFVIGSLLVFYTLVKVVASAAAAIVQPEHEMVIGLSLFGTFLLGTLLMFRPWS